MILLKLVLFVMSAAVVIVEYKGKWYFFYHTADLALKNIPEGSEERKYIRWRRSVCVEELFYNPDGTIRKVVQTQQE